MFVMYKVRQVRNTGSQALAFELDPHNIVAVAPDKESNDTLDDAQLLGSQNLTKVEVPAGQTKNVGTCFIKEVSSANPQALVLAQVPLVHKVSTAQPVRMTNVSPNGNLIAIGNAVPDELQALCSGN
jgi:hypothetical protein